MVARELRLDRLVVTGAAGRSCPGSSVVLGDVDEADDALMCDGAWRCYVGGAGRSKARGSMMVWELILSLIRRGLDDECEGVVPCVRSR